eukprot:Gb_20455 [translate_table: standard]
MGILLQMHFQSVGTAAYPLASISASNLSFSKSLVGFKWVHSHRRIIGKKQCSGKIHGTKAAAADEGEAKVALDEKEVTDFDQRLSRIRRKYRSGTGKKAEIRKLKKGKVSRRTGILLPPIPLKDPISEGLKVELGFNSYTERLNGRFAALGLAAVLLVELASGQSLIKYHAPGTLILQIYFVLAMAAIFVKYEKEKKSVWPKKKS